MGTSCRIGMMENGMVRSTICHHDGYISNAGLILNEYYSDRDKLNRLLDKGNISTLGTKVENTTFYSGEGEEAIISDLSEFIRQAYYNYLFDVQSGKWIIYHEMQAVFLKEALTELSIFYNLEGGYFKHAEDEFNGMEGTRKRLARGEQRWFSEDHETIRSIVDTENCVVDVYHYDYRYDANDEMKRITYHLYIPCSSLEDGLAISDSVYGKAFEELRKEYGLIRVKETE